MHPLTLSSSGLVRLLKSLSPAASGSHLSASSIHCLLLKSGLLFSGAYLPTALLSAYADLGRPGLARDLFDEMPSPGLVPRTAMARAHAASDQPLHALALFRGMVSDGVLPDNVALAIALAACHNAGSCAAKKLGRMIHAFTITRRIATDRFVSTELIRIYGECSELVFSRRVFDEMPARSVVAWNAMMHQYVKRGDVQAARKLFLGMPIRDVVSWNTLIAGYWQAGLCREALGLFREMVLPPSSVVRPNAPTMNTVLGACASAGCLETGIWVHAYIDNNGMNTDGSLDNLLIGMYAKCGSIERAVQVFDKAPGKMSLHSWTSVICGLAAHGRAADALQMFDMMRENGLQPDDVTLVGALNACAHGGLVEEGLCYFYSMEEKYGLAPKLEHYGCMVDLLGRVGRLKEAYELAMTMPMKPNAVIWGALLSASKVHGNVEVGEVAAAKLIELNPGDPWGRVMLSSMYAEAQDWSGLVRGRKEMNSLRMKKTPGRSSIELDGQVHEFVARRSLQHP